LLLFISNLLLILHFFLNLLRFLQPTPEMNNGCYVATTNVLTRRTCVLLWK
jgi:hypothetical protein